MRSISRSKIPTLMGYFSLRIPTPPITHQRAHFQSAFLVFFLITTALVELIFTRLPTRGRWILITQPRRSSSLLHFCAFNAGLLQNPPHNHIF